MSQLDRSNHTKERALGEFNLNHTTCPGSYDLPNQIGPKENFYHLKKSQDSTYNNYNNRSLIINSLFHDAKNEISSKDFRHRFPKGKKKTFFDGSGVLSEKLAMNKKNY
jgi:hypothetical protein